jgi:hypothetical protein
MDIMSFKCVIGDSGGIGHWAVLLASGFTSLRSTDQIGNTRMEASESDSPVQNEPHFMGRPDWRWQWACAIQDRSQSRRSSDPAWLPLLLALAERAHPSGNTLSELPVPAILLQALELYQSQGQLVWELEARILAGQTDQEIEEATAVPAAVIAAYEHAFFNVRNRLEAEDYISIVVIERSNFCELDESDLKGLWAHYGYSAGPRMLELVMAVSLGRPLPEWALREAPSAADAEVLELRIRAMLIAETGPLTAAKLRKLNVLRAQIDELQQKSAPKGMKELVQACVLGAPELFGEACDRAAPTSDGFEEPKSEVSRPSHAEVA